MLWGSAPLVAIVGAVTFGVRAAYLVVWKIRQRVWWLLAPAFATGWLPFLAGSFAIFVHGRQQKAVVAVDCEARTAETQTKAQVETEREGQVIRGEAEPRHQPSMPGPVDRLPEAQEPIEAAKPWSFRAGK